MTMKYTLFIDESGDFESDRGQWLISGFLCNADYVDSSFALQNICRSLPSLLDLTSIRDFHLTEFRSRFGHEKALKKAGTLIDTLSHLPFNYHFLTTINRFKIKINNREKTYRIMLFDLLALLESVLPEGERIEKLDIIVATRTFNGVRQTNLSDIEDDVIRNLPQALEVDLATKGLVDLIGSKISIKLEYANNEWGLVVADFLANINYHNKRKSESQIIQSLQQKRLYTAFETFGQHKERRAFVAERDGDYALASLRWLLMLENEPTEAASIGLKRTFLSLITKLGGAGPRTAFESLLDRLWRLCKPKLEYERFIKLLSRLKVVINDAGGEGITNLAVFTYRTNVFLLKVLNHIGNSVLAFELLSEQKKLASQVAQNPDNLSLIMEGILVESEVFFNDLDFENALKSATQSYEIAENYTSLSAIILDSENSYDASHSVFFLKAKMNYLRHIIRKENDFEKLLDILSIIEKLAPYLDAADSSRQRFMQSQLLLKLEKLDDAIAVTSELFDGSHNEFDKLAYLKAVNFSLASGNPVTEKMLYLSRRFAQEHTLTAYHPLELVYRELAIFFCLNEDMKSANKLIRKSANAITANNSKISDYLHEENTFLQDLFKSRLDKGKNYFSNFNFEIDIKNDRNSIIKALASYSPL
jgi:hypothetical protein